MIPAYQSIAATIVIGLLTALLLVGAVGAVAAICANRRRP